MGIMETEQDIDPTAFPEGWTSGGPDVAAANAAIAGAGETNEEDVPLMETPPDTLVVLPGGLFHNGEVYREATVRELNGEDEELLSRALMGTNAVRYLQTLLERGVVEIGPVKVDSKILDGLLVGDRETLMLGIRRATYGDEFEMEVRCPNCLITAEIKVLLNEEVPVKPLAWAAFHPEQHVTLRAGDAVVRLANGADWRHLNGLENKTAAELNTALFGRCVKSLNGAPFTAIDAKKLSARDRKTLIDWMADNQPGPEYDKVKWTCDACGTEVPLNLSAADLFPR